MPQGARLRLRVQAHLRGWWDLRLPVPLNGPGRSQRIPVPQVGGGAGVGGTLTTTPREP